MEVLFIFPGRSFEKLNEFLQRGEVRIGYSLNKELYSLKVEKRLEFIGKVARERGPINISKAALKRRINQWNSFFDITLKYVLIPDVGWKKYFVGRLEPKVLFDINSEYYHVRKFTLINTLSLAKKYQNNKGISRMLSTRIQGLDDLISAYENKNQELGKLKFYSDEEEIYGFEGEQKELITKHLRKERDKNFVLKYRTTYKHIISCPACSFNGRDKYGFADGNSMLEIHHIVPLKNITGKHKVTNKDVSFLCPNCHRAIHKIMALDLLRTISIDEFRKRIL